MKVNRVEMKENKYEKHIAIQTTTDLVSDITNSHTEIPNLTSE